MSARAGIIAISPRNINAPALLHPPLLELLVAPAPKMTVKGAAERAIDEAAAIQAQLITSSLADINTHRALQTVRSAQTCSPQARRSSSIVDL